MEYNFTAVKVSLQARVLFQVCVCVCTVVNIICVWVCKRLCRCILCLPCSARCTILSLFKTQISSPWDGLLLEVGRIYDAGSSVRRAMKKKVFPFTDHKWIARSCGFTEQKYLNFFVDFISLWAITKCKWFGGHKKSLSGHLNSLGSPALCLQEMHSQLTQHFIPHPYLDSHNLHRRTQLLQTHYYHTALLPPDSSSSFIFFWRECIITIFELSDLYQRCVSQHATESLRTIYRPK